MYGYTYGVKGLDALMAGSVGWGFTGFRLMTV